MKHNIREVLSVSSEQVEPQEKFWDLLTLKAILINMNLGSYVLLNFCHILHGTRLDKLSQFCGWKRVKM